MAGHSGLLLRRLRKLVCVPGHPRLRPRPFGERRGCPGHL